MAIPKITMKTDMDGRPWPQLDMFAGNHTPQQRARTAKRVQRMAHPTIESRFAEFHAANPHVLTEMLRLARSRLARGEHRIGVKALWEELRVSLDLAEDGGGLGAYKLNNDFTAIYARRLIDLEPSLAGVIELRKRKTP